MGAILEVLEDTEDLVHPVMEIVILPDTEAV